MEKYGTKCKAEAAGLVYKKGVGIRKGKRHNPKAEIKSVTKLVSISQPHGCLLIQRQQQYVSVFSYALRSSVINKRTSRQHMPLPYDVLEKGSAALCENTAQDTPSNSGRYLSHQSKT